ncbi:MAG: competence/damage-inducible protein A [Bacteroidia bacterium]
MKAEILTIGDEILIGQITNTNSVWIAQQLNILGIKVAHMASVSDEKSAITKAFSDAEARAGIVFITGGLGPTKDDITKKLFAEYFNTILEIDTGVLEHVRSFFTKRGRELSELNRQQALVPKGCFVVHNEHGTAPGMWIKKGGTIFISMPGVPYEMKTMMSDIILPKLKREFKFPAIYHKTVLTQGIGESALAELIEPWEDQLAAKNIKLAYLPQPGIVRLRLSTSGADEAEIRKSVETEIEALNGLIKKYIYGYEAYGEAPPSLEKIVSELLREKKQTVALAESCTGGYIASLFTGLPGSSDIFKGAMVPYTNMAKHELLGVETSVFETEGAVSKSCVTQMAESVRKKFRSDYGISTSGIAGPGGGTAEKPVGTVWVAVAAEEKTIALKFVFGDDRNRNIQMTGNAALNMLRKFILKDDSDSSLLL